MVFADQTKAYFKDSEVDAVALRVDVLEKLTLLASTIERLTAAPEAKLFWQKLRDIASTDPALASQKDKYAAVFNQIIELHPFVIRWIALAVESPQRFDFFVRTKAEEIQSGDEKRDYYWALAIRHDQLIGLVRVLEAMVEHLKRLLKLPVDQVLSDPVILGLLDHSVEDQIYLEAEAVYQSRDTAAHKE